MTSLLERVGQFLFLEARLMDENRYREWLALFTADALYWVPANREDVDPLSEVSILYAPRPMLEEHIRRLEDGAAFAQSPQSRLRRMVSNIEIATAPADVDVADDPLAVVEVRSNFLITEIRKHSQRVHAGHSIHLLRPAETSFRIARKKVVLLGLDEPQDNVTFLL